MAVVGESAPSVLKEYYGILTGGIESYGEGQELAPLLAEQLDFEGPIAGKIMGRLPFLQGVKGFIANVSRIDLVQEVHGPEGTAVLYDAYMPKGVVRLTEFFQISDGKIQRLRLLYDPAQYVMMGGA